MTRDQIEDNKCFQDGSYFHKSVELLTQIESGFKNLAEDAAFVAPIFHFDDTPNSQPCEELF